MSEQIINEIKRLETERGRALVQADWTALASLLADDLVHVHTSGVTDDKTNYLAAVSTKLEFLKVERVSLKVRCYSEIAIATGVVTQSVRVKGPGTVVDIRMATTQVWVLREGRWLQNTFQATRIEQA